MHMGWNIACTPPFTPHVRTCETPDLSGQDPMLEACAIVSLIALIFRAFGNGMQKYPGFDMMP